MFGLKSPDDAKMISTADAIFEKLTLKNTGGLARYEGDNYQRVKEDTSIPGNPWIITTLWGANYYIARGQMDRAKELIDWVAGHSQQTEVFSEQINPYSGEHLSISPLVWSHAEFT